MRESSVILICIFSIALSGVQAAPTYTQPECGKINALQYINCLSYCSVHKHVCEAYPGASCYVRQTSCKNGCDVYYMYNGVEVNCNPKVQLPGHQATCPDGSAPLTCSDQSCDESSCPSHPFAKCIGNTCNNCTAEYYVIGRNNDAFKVDCISTVCPKDAVEVSCPPDLCDYFPCPNYPDARCVVDNCTQCHVDFVLPNGKVLKRESCVDQPVCTKQRDTTCRKNICRASFCPGDMTIWCRMNDCGGCKAEWYNSSTGEIISCPYYDQLFAKIHKHGHSEHTESRTEPVIDNTHAHSKSSSNVVGEHAHSKATSSVDGKHALSNNVPVVDKVHAHSKKVPVVPARKYPTTTTPPEIAKPKMTLEKGLEIIQRVLKFLSVMQKKEQEKHASEKHEHKKKEKHQKPGSHKQHKDKKHLDKHQKPGSHRQHKDKKHPKRAPPRLVQGGIPVGGMKPFDISEG